MNILETIKDACDDLNSMGIELVGVKIPIESRKAVLKEFNATKPFEKITDIKLIATKPQMIMKYSNNKIYVEWQDYKKFTYPT